MAAQQRNPLLGGIFALLFIGFGAYRFFMYYTEQADMPTWQLILAGAFIVYGLFVGYTVLTQKKESDNE
ncbi:hypothetical protein [Nonlabens marinus]|uniref:Uncharacterized protein n=1 Tax=Nonlabens marinus S1-08 TaxID=1454201 RepID=W8VQV9_9FLAO|nr:hypothetical protein [Nonlabens marinus]BAO55929.1 hypothetical protein NMS_1920 [Nonlabens marinus S1-08]